MELFSLEKLMVEKKGIVIDKPIMEGSMKEIIIIGLLVFTTKTIMSYKSPSHTYSYKMVKYELSKPNTISKN